MGLGVPEGKRVAQAKGTGVLGEQVELDFLLYQPQSQRKSGW